MRKIAYILSFVMLPLVAMAGDIKYTRPVLTLKNEPGKKPAYGCKRAVRFRRICAVQRKG